MRTCKQKVCDKSLVENDKHKFIFTMCTRDKNKLT